jgi:hypothetical protein
VSEARREVDRRLAARRPQKSSDPSQYLAANDELAVEGVE